ncbi:MAG: class I SAM-dependent methyltransferase [Microbacterium sp.]
MRGFTPETWGERAAEIYDAQLVPDEDTTRSAIQYLNDFLPASASVLEIGAGTGRLAIPLAECGHHVVALDVSGPMLDKLTEKITGRALPIETVRADITVSPVDGAFDACLFAFNTFMLIGSKEQQEQALENIRPSLKSGSHIILETFVMPESMLNIPGPPQFLRVSEITADSVILTATMLDREASRLDAQNIHITERGIKLYPHQTTYRAIEEQDELVERVLDCTLVRRTADWREQPFAGKRSAISVYHKEG